MKRKLLIITITLLSSLMIVGCEKAPEQELSIAKAALDSARIAGAQKYLLVDFNAAQDSLNAATAEINKQKSGSILTVTYSKAKELLTSTTQTARQLSAQCQTINQKLLSDIDTSLLKANSLFSEANELLSTAQKGKTDKSTLDTITNNLSGVELLLVEIPKIKEQGDLTEAQVKINTAIENLGAIKIKLTQVPAEKKSKK
jgi:hypothetical protein